MGKDSKKRRADRKALRQNWALDQLKNTGVGSLPSSGPIPQAVARQGIDDLLEKHIKEENLKLVFAKYNHATCQLDHLDAKLAKKLIVLFNRVTETNLKNLPGSGIVRDNVEYDGAYKSLFANLPPDVSLKEAEYSETGRVFFYMVSNFFCIVSICVKHL